MGIINRFLLFLYALAVACLSLGVVALALQIVPEPILLNEYRYLMGAQQWQLVAGGVLVFLLSIHLIGCSFSGGSDKREGGEFHNLVEQTVQTVPGVRSLQVKVSVAKKAAKDGAQLSLRLAIVIGKEANAAAVSDDIRTEVRRAMQETMGVDEFSLDIVVEDISNAPLTKKKRVV